MGRSKYTQATDAAVDRARRAVHCILADTGTTARDKMEVLHDLTEYIRQNWVDAEEEAGQRG